MANPERHPETTKRPKRDVLTVRIPEEQLRGAITPVDRDVKTLSELRAYLRRVRSEMKGRRDFVDSATHWTEQVSIIRQAYDSGSIKPAEFDLLLGALIADKEYAGEMDMLTETYNRRAFLNRAEEIFSAAKRSSTPVSFAIIDLDKFKDVNDTYGHDTGDAVLQQAAGYLNDSKRTEDVLARWGGEEFVLLLPGTPKEQAAVMIQRVINGLPAATEEALSDMGIRIDQRVTASVGIAEMSPSNDKTPNDIFKDADAALYAAKDIVGDGGRNRALIIDEPIDGSPTFRNLATGERFRERVETIKGQTVHYYDKIEI